MKKSKFKENVWERDLPELRNKKKEQLTYGREIMTDKEYEKKRKKILKKKLP